MNKALIWCVDDDAAIRDIEVYTLIQTGFEARGFSSGEEMLSALRNEKPQLIVLDIMMPEMDGTEVLKKLKSNSATSNIPVIMATAKGTEMDKIQGLDGGADDYLVKPFGVMEMVSRIKAVLRRCTPDIPADMLAVGEIILLEREHTVTVEGAEIGLTLKEFEILRLLMKNIGIVFSRERLFSEIWGADYIGETRTVDMHIKTLRRKLGRAGVKIETVIGIGYKMSDI